MPHIKTKSGIRWHYELDGAGANLLFIHGWGVDKRIWRQQTKHFTKSHRVLSVDLPGHGKSAWRSILLEEMAQDLGDILYQLGIMSTTIVASSLGGLVTIKLYELHPEKIERIVFVGSMPKFAKTEHHPFGLDIAQIRKLNSQLERAYPSIIDVFFRSLFSEEERQSRRFKWLQTFRKTDQEKPMKGALMEYLDIIENEDLRETFKTIDRPVQFINGKKDIICCVDSVKYMQKMLPNAQYDFFENCGHFSFLSKPYEFNQLLEDFLNKK